MLSLRFLFTRKRLITITNIENLPQFKRRFSSVTWQVHASASINSLVREMKNIYTNFKKWLN